VDAQNIPERVTLLAGFRLGEWVVKPEDGSLISPAGADRLEPLLMELLVFLCSRAGQVVSKQDLLDTVWEGRFVSDETIKSSLYELRKALRDRPRQPRFIETLPKRGYRVLLKPVPIPAAAQLPASPESDAREACRRGRTALSGRPDAVALEQAELYFQRATHSDPRNAEAQSGLAFTYILLGSLGPGRSAEYLQRAGAAALRAVESDPNLAEAHVGLGVVRFLQDHDFASAEDELRLAMELDPADALAHRWYSRLLSSRGLHDAAVAAARRALQADPLSLPARRDLLEALFLARRYSDAIAEAHRLLEISPRSTDVQLGMVWIYYLQKKDSEALAAFLSGLESMGIAPALVKQAAGAFERGGMAAVFQLWLEVLEHEAKLGQRNQGDVLILHALLGHVDRCFALMEVACRERHPYLLWLPVSPLFDVLRRDTRFPEFMTRLGLQD
jgi:DNA-binding winged helix-turn-helix (wHTH) protein